MRVALPPAAGANPAGGWVRIENSKKQFQPQRKEKQRLRRDKTRIECVKD